MTQDIIHEEIRQISVFISYSRKDSQTISWFKKILEDKGFKINLDKTDIAPGELWKDKISSLISSSDKVLYFASSNSISSPICEWEVEQAVEQNKVLIPVIISYGIEDKVPKQLSERNFLYARTLNEREANINSLMEIIRIDIYRAQQHTRFGSLADLWIKEGKHSTSGKLLRKEDLLEAEVYLSNSSNREPYTTQNQIEFITASRNFAAEELKIEQTRITKTLELQKRSKNYLILFAIILGFVAIFLAFYDRSVSKSESVLYHSRAMESLKTGYAEDAIRYALSFISTDYRLPWRYRSEELNKTLAAAALTVVDKKISSIWFGSQYGLDVNYSSSGGYVVAGNYSNVHQNIYEKTPLFSIFSGKDLIRKTDFFGSMRTFKKIKLSPDMKTVFSFGSSNTLDIWSATTGAEQFRMIGHKDKIIDAVFVDSLTVRSISKDGTVRYWDASSGKEVKLIQIGDIQGAEFSSDGSMLVVASYEGISVWDLTAEKQLINIMVDMNDFKSVVFSPDGTRFIVAYYGENPKLYNASTGKMVDKLEGSDAMFDVFTKRILSLDGNKVYRYFYDGTGIQYADSKEGDLLLAIFTSDGTRLLTLSKSGVIELWDQRGALIGNIRASSGTIIGLDINRNNEIVFAQSDGNIIVSSIYENNIHKIYGTQTYFKKAQFSSNNDTLLMVAQSGDIFIRKDGEKFMDKLENINSEDKIDVSFANDDSKLVVSQEDGLSIFSMIDGSYYKFFNSDSSAQLENEFVYHKYIKFSNDGSYFASFGHIFKSSNIDNPIKIKGNVFKMDGFSKNNKYLITHSRYRSAQIWDVDTGNLVKEIDTGIMEKIGNVDISDDNASIAISIGRTVQVWSLAAESKIMQGSDFIFPVEWVVFASDQRTVMAGGRDGIVRILSSDTGREILAMRGHKGAVRYIARNKNKSIALSQGEDNTIRVWNIKNGDGLVVMNGYGDSFGGFLDYGSDFAGFNHDGNFVYKVQGNGTVVVKEISLLNETDQTKIVGAVCSDIFTNITKKYSARQLEDPVITDRNFSAIRAGDVCRK